MGVRRLPALGRGVDVGGRLRARLQGGVVPLRPAAPGPGWLVGIDEERRAERHTASAGSQCRRNVIWLSTVVGDRWFIETPHADQTARTVTNSRSWGHRAVPSGAPGADVEYRWTGKGR